MRNTEKPSQLARAGRSLSRSAARSVAHVATHVLDGLAPARGLGQVGRVVCQGIHVLHDTGVQPLQGREDLLAHADAEEPRVAIRWIEAVRNAVTPDMGVDVAPPGLEHRADALPVAGRHHSETP